MTNTGLVPSTDTQLVLASLMASAAFFCAAQAQSCMRAILHFPSTASEPESEACWQRQCAASGQPRVLELPLLRHTVMFTLSPVCLLQYVATRDWICCADVWGGLGYPSKGDSHQGEDPNQELLPELQAAFGVGPDRAASECQAP